MIFLLLAISCMCGRSCVMLFDKWKIHDYGNTHKYLSYIWPGNPCNNCLAFWFTLIGFNLLVFFPYTILFIGPLSCWPILSILNKMKP